MAVHGDGRGGDSLVLLAPQVRIVPVSDSVWEALQARSAQIERQRVAQRRRLEQEAVARLDTVCPFRLSGEPYAIVSWRGGLPAAVHLGVDFPRPLPPRRGSNPLRAGAIPYRANGGYQAIERPALGEWQALHTQRWGGAFVFVVAFSLVASLLYVAFRSRSVEIARALLRVGSFDRVEAIASMGLSLHALLFDLLYALLEAYVAWYGLLLLGSLRGVVAIGSWGLLAILAAGFAGRVWLQYACVTLAGRLLGVGRFGYTLWTQGQVINRLAWPLLLVLCAAYTVAPVGTVRWVYLCALALVALVALARNGRLVAAFRHYGVSAYYILLYLCALEILPILLIGKWLRVY